MEPAGVTAPTPAWRMALTGQIEMRVVEQAGERRVVLWRHLVGTGAEEAARERIEAVGLLRIDPRDPRGRP